MIREKIVFGPIFSRRLGSSLGINLLPENGKLCNFDCIYCECGWNRDGREDKRLPDTEDLSRALELKLSECREQGTAIDSITFSGDGEPTLNPHFPEMIDATLTLRDKYYPDAKVSVLSNATMVHKKSVLEALKKVDNPIMKIDAPTDELAELINHPAPGYSVQAVVEALKGFGGDFVLQTMFLRSDAFDSSDPEQLNAWFEIVRNLRPREIMVYTIDRETPQEGLVRFSAEKMRELVQPLVDEGYKVQVKG